jgi:SAM-dependent methyltransferase
MYESLVKFLVDPVSKSPLSLVEGKYEDDRIMEGKLRGLEGRLYTISNGIPRFGVTEDQDQKQTENSFAFKWQQRNSYDSPQWYDALIPWALTRFGFETIEDMRAYFGSRRRVLDAGCGGGMTTSLWINPFWRGDGQAEWLGIDISSAIDVAQERLGSIPGTNFIQADILQLPFPEQTFDAIFSEGVLHHTPSTELALKSLATVLESGGEFLFYVYKKKSPIREFTDDHIRNAISSLPPDEAWALLRPLTKLGKALADLHADIEVPEDIPYLGIKAGRYDVQRLIYWHFAKLYWRDTFTFEENNHVNFDWYHPKYATRHTEEELRRWCSEANLTITRFDTQEAGYTIRATKN